MNIKFTFKVVAGNLYEYNTEEKLVHYKNSNGYEIWKEYDSNGRLIHTKHSAGIEFWFDYNGILTHCRHPNGIEHWYDSDGKPVTKLLESNIN